MTIEDILALSPVLPVVTLRRVEQAVPLARALVAGGLRAVEITLRTPEALAGAREIAREVHEIVLGVGTVLSPKDLRDAEDAGAAFAVSPGVTPDLLEHARDMRLPYLPAVATASDLMAAMERGFTTFKFFPASVAGGPAAIKALGGPFPGVRFCPTGGIGLATARDYLALPNVLCVGGSWMAPDEALDAGDFARIEALAREAAALA